MISVDRLLYKIDQRLNKLSSNSHQQIQLEDKLLALNEAQILLVKQKVNGISVPNGMGMDAFKKRYDDLQGLVINYDKQPLTLLSTNEQLNEYSAQLNSLDPSYFLYLDGYLTADKGECKNKKIWLNPDLIKHGSLQFLLTNEHYKPSFEYEETFCSISSGYISVYTDGTFTPKKLYLMYIKYPTKINKEGYIDFDGEASTTVDCELPESLENELLNLAVKHLGMDTENASAVNSAQTRIATQE